MTYLTTSRFSRVLNVPISLPQTELKRLKFLNIATIKLEEGQQFEVRYLAAHLINILTSGSVPYIKNTALGYVSVNISQSPMTCGGTVLNLDAPGVKALNPMVDRRYSAAGTYFINVSNNMQNMDLTVCVSGVAKLYI